MYNITLYSYIEAYNMYYVIISMYEKKSIGLRMWVTDIDPLMQLLSDEPLPKERRASVD